MPLRSLALGAACVALSGCHDRAPASPEPPLVIRSAPPQSPSRDVVRIAPGAAVGPIRLGMLREEVEALGVLRRHPRYATLTTPYQVAYDETGRVRLVTVSLAAAPADVRVDPVTLPRGTGFLEARRLLDDCTAPEIGFGGGSYSCRGGLIEVSGGSGSPGEIWIGTHAPR